MEHLHESTKVVAQDTDKKRILYMKSARWIGYPAAKNILDKLEDLLEHPTILRMPNMLITGETNNGKSVLIHRFFTKHKPAIAPGDTHLIAPVIYAVVPHQPDEKKFYDALLNALHAPYKVIDRVERKHQQVFHLLTQLQTKVLILDEIHHVLAGTMSKRQAFLNLLKNMSTLLKISIVAAGTEEASFALSSDSQLSNRFHPSRLPRWQMDDDYLRLLSSFEALLPLKKPSGLAEDRDLALRVLALSEGKIGEISAVLTLAAISAIKSGKEYIDRNTLSSIDYMIPSDRRKTSIG